MNDSTRKTQELQGSIEKEGELNKDIRVMLIEDHELVRYGLRSMLEQEEDMEVVGDCSNAREALSQLGMLSPDIVVIDVRMSGANGIEATHSLTRNGWNCVVLADSADYEAKALEAGASSYILKDMTRTELVQAIREAYWSRQLPEDRHGAVRKTIELVVPPRANAAQLLRFTCQLQEMLEDNYGDITQMVGSWEWGTVITILLESGSFANLSEELNRMPDVARLEEGSTARVAHSGHPKQSRVAPRVSINPSKTICVVLKETVTAT